jgi:hypothetical protein
MKCRIFKNARVFDPLKDCFDPLKRMDYKAAGFVAALQAFSSPVARPV